MALEAKLSTLDGVPEALHEHYAQQSDGTFRLVAKGVEYEEDVKGLKTALEREREERRKAKERLEQLGDVDPEEYRRLKEEAEERETGKLKDKGEFEALRARLEERHQKAVESKEQEIQRRDRFIERLLVDNEIDKAMDEVKVLPEHRRAVRALLKESRPQVKADGEDYRATVQTDMGETSLATYIQEWSKSEEAGHYIAGRGVNGSGASSTRSAGADGGVNPWKRETRNLTEQMRIAKENPDLAKRLAAQAGLALSL